MKVTKLEISDAEKGKPDSFPTNLFLWHHGLREQVKSRQSQEMPSPSSLASPFLPLYTPPSRTSSSFAATSAVLSLLTVGFLCLFHLKCNSFQTKSKEDYFVLLSTHALCRLGLADWLVLLMDGLILPAVFKLSRKFRDWIVV